MYNHAEHMRDYRRKNKEKCIEINKKWLKTPKGIAYYKSILKYNKKYYNKNKDKIGKRYKKWFETPTGIVYCKNKLKNMRKYNSFIMFGGNREKVLERDNYICKICGKNHHQVVLVVHHIDGNGANTKAKNNNMDNLVTWCKSCHARYHRLKTVSIVREGK